MGNPFLNSTHESPRSQPRRLRTIKRRRGSMAGGRNLLTDTALPRQVDAQRLTDWDVARDALIRECRIRNLSEHTVKYYRNELDSLRKALASNGAPTDPTKVSADDIKEALILPMM